MHPHICRLSGHAQRMDQNLQGHINHSDFGKPPPSMQVSNSRHCALRGQSCDILNHKGPVDLDATAIWIHKSCSCAFCWR